MAPNSKLKAAPAEPAVNEAPAVPEKVVKPVESVYTAEELTENHKVFNTSREIVEVALRIAGKKTATFTEAKEIIDKFRNKEVK